MIKMKFLVIGCLFSILGIQAQANCPNFEGQYQFYPSGSPEIFLTVTQKGCSDLEFKDEIPEIGFEKILRLRTDGRPNIEFGPTANQIVRIYQFDGNGIAYSEKDISIEQKTTRHETGRYYFSNGFLVRDYEVQTQAERYSGANHFVRVR
jgi:hypothetical protein